jgi:hypothetical protein
MYDRGETTYCTQLVLDMFADAKLIHATASPVMPADFLEHIKQEAGTNPLDAMLRDGVTLGGIHRYDNWG